MKELKLPYYFLCWVDTKLRQYIGLHPGIERNPGKPPRAGIVPGGPLLFSLAKYNAALHCVGYGKSKEGKTNFKLRDILEEINDHIIMRGHQISLNLLRVWRNEERFQGMVDKLRRECALDYFHAVRGEDSPFFLGAKQDLIRTINLLYEQKDYPERLRKEVGYLFSRTARADEGKERNLREKMMALVYLIISYAHEDRPLDPERLFTDGFFPLLDKTVGLFNNQENWRERSKYTYAIKHGIARSFCLVGEVLKDTKFCRA